MLSLAVIVLLSVISNVNAACSASYAASYDLSLTPSTLKTNSVTFPGGIYYLHPCDSVDVTLCPYSAGAQQCFAITTWEVVSDGLGDKDSTSWTALDGDWSKGAVAESTDISYDYDQCNADPGTNSFKVTYKCVNGDDSLTLISEPDASKNGVCKFEFSVDSSVVCGTSGGGGGGDGDGGSKKGMSGGWIFVILLVVGISVYVMGGVAYNRYRKGASGVEMLPNHEFWKGLPSLVKDGCSFFVQKCRGLCGRSVGGSADSTSFTTM